MNKSKSDNKPKPGAAAKTDAKTSTQAKKPGAPSTSTSKNAPTKKTPAKTVKPEPKVEAKPVEVHKEPSKPELTEEEKKKHRSATQIQCAWRTFKAKAVLLFLKKEKVDLDEKLKRLEQEAYVQMIKMEQEREEKKRLKKLKEKQLKQKREQRKKKFLEAAYDGNLQDLKFLINDLEKELDELAREDKSLDNARKKQAILALYDCKDMNGNSALSEAAAGGDADVCKFLLSQNADPNSRGAFGRTPLWRSAFAGHLNCVQVLLENGGDPRLYSNDGQRCADAATKDNVIDLLNNWNIQLTERMLQQIEKTRLQFKQEQMVSLEAKKKTAHDEHNRVNSQYEVVKNELYKCNCELQRLNDEYLLNEQMYGPLIDKKEAEKAELTTRYDELREKAFKARINYKDLLAEVRKEKKQIKNSKTGADVDAHNEEEDEEKKNDDDSDDDEDLDGKMTRINIKEIDDMILRDLTGVVKNSLDKWPLIIDQNEQASTFLRYRDTNYVNCLDMQSMQLDKFRVALIGAIRYGKPFVLDVMQYDTELVESIKSVCDQIDPNLFEEMCSKKLAQNERYMRLVKLEKDGKEYEAQNFNAIRLKNFKVLFLTSNPYPNDKLVKATMPIKIVTSSAVNADDLDI
jgi:hypothetical protein